MTQFKKLAIASAIAASFIVATNAQAHVSYHIPPAGTAPSTTTANGTVDDGSWTGGSPTAKGYVARLPIHWLANVHANDVNYEVSAADAINNKGAASAFELSSYNNKWKKSDSTSISGGASWGHALDFGLINMEVAGNLTLEVQADSLSSNFTPGFTIWNGWGDVNSGDKHSAWNFLSPEIVDFYVDFLGATPSGSDTALPLYLQGVSYLGESATTISGGSTSLTLNNLAAGKYIVFIGGNGTENTDQTYMANISVSAVPIPAAVWLMGSAMLGLMGMRRKQAVE